MADIELANRWRRGWSLPFRGEIYEYAADLDLQNGYAIKGQFGIARSKYLIAPFQAIRNPRVRQVVILKAVQTGGSLLADIWVPYTIEHDPGDTLWLLQDDKFANTYMQSRFLPLLERTKSIKPWLQAAGRFGIKKDELLLPHMSVMMGGLNEGNVQSFSRRHVIIDEAWMAKSNGLIRQAKDRATAYPYTSKVLIISQAGVEGDDLDLEWKSSTMMEWHWQCPHCTKHQPFKWSEKRDDGSWSGMYWETSETTRPNGRWDYKAVFKTARLECHHCGHRVEDTPANRRRLDDTHEYRTTNPGADPTIAGFHWPAIANQDITFGGLVVKYLRAKEQHEEHGYVLPLVEFYQKQLATPWNLNTSADYRRVSYEPYDVVSDWDREAYRFLTVDCQKDFKEFWTTARAWAGDGETRQLARKRLESWEEVAAFQAEWKVKDQHVFVDCGYEQTRVAAECVKHGHVGSVGGRKVWLCWVALKGVRQETFTHTNPQTKISDKRVYSELDYLTPNIGQGGGGYRCPFFAWSNLSVKDILRRHRDGEAAKFLSLPDTDPPSDVWSYTAQMNSEIRVKERDDNGKQVSIWRPVNNRRPNHYWDCEAMQIVAALVCGIIGDMKQEDEKK
jgi:hypothetical protein